MAVREVLLIPKTTPVGAHDPADVPSSPSSSQASHREAKPTPVPALRQALRAFFAMTTREADGDLPTPEEVQGLLSEIRRLWDDVGPAFAEAIHLQEARAYFRETGRCPTCGEPGVFHEPVSGQRGKKIP